MFGKKKKEDKGSFPEVPEINKKKGKDGEVIIPYTHTVTKEFIETIDVIIDMKKLSIKVDSETKASLENGVKRLFEGKIKPVLEKEMEEFYINLLTKKENEK